MKLGLILTYSGKWGEISSTEMGGQVPRDGEGCLYIGEEETDKKKMKSQFLEIP